MVPAGSSAAPATRAGSPPSRAVQTLRRTRSAIAPGAGHRARRAAHRDGRATGRFTLTPSLSHADGRGDRHGCRAHQPAARLRQGGAGPPDRHHGQPARSSSTDVLGRLVALYPSCMVFSVDGFLGASPELLISRTGDRVTSHPLAGTVARSGDAHADEALVAGLLASPKARREHRVVIDVLRRALAPVCAESGRPRGAVGAGPAQRVAPGHPDHAAGCARRHPADGAGAGRPRPPHAGRGRDPDRRRRSDTCSRSRASTVAATPARWAGSTPRRRRLGYRNPLRRGIRRDGRIFAGNGIVAASRPADELAETQLKLQALLAALVRP